MSAFKICTEKSSTQSHITKEEKSQVKEIILIFWKKRNKEGPKYREVNQIITTGASKLKGSALLSPELKEGRAFFLFFPWVSGAGKVKHDVLYSH